MTTKYRTKGFVFKKTDRLEADRVFSVFTKDFGRLEIRGRAIRKINSKLKAGIDVFYFSDIEFIQGKNHKTLTDAVKIKNPVKNLSSFDAAGRVACALDSFLKGQEKDENIFNLLDEVFGKLDCRLVCDYFIWNFLSLLGYHQEVNACASCHGKLSPENIYFSGATGGIICKNCLAKDKTAKEINSDVVKILRIILSKDWQTLSKLKIEPHSQKLLSEISQTAINSFCPS